MELISSQVYLASAPERGRFTAARGSVKVGFLHHPPTPQPAIPRAPTHVDTGLPHVLTFSMRLATQPGVYNVRSRTEVPRLPLLFIFNILSTLLTIMMWAIIARALISWFDRGMRNPISQLLVQITEPFIAPIRRVLPTAGMIDFSPMVAILLIYVLQMMLTTAVR